ncbi:MAG TPA: DinB family protein [Streptosporangiaceae bacterium]
MARRAHHGIIGRIDEFPEPTAPAPSRAEVFLRYLDYFRSRLAAKLEALPAAELRRSRLPSGWTPLELAKHLRYVELRWLEWGFEGRDVGDPWGDRDDGRWRIGPDETLASLLAGLRDQAGRTRAIVESHDLAEVGQPGPRWDGAPPATLERVLFHLLQEYARHLGHLDIVVEIVTGQAGELRTFLSERSVVQPLGRPRARDG